MQNKKLISTSALAKKMSIEKYQLDKQLLEIKYIIKDGDKFKLTELGIQNGGTIKEHSKFGQYIAWDENMKMSNIEVTEKIDSYASGKIGTKYNISARKINMILSEIGFIEKHLKGWKITSLGSKNDGIQKENSKSGVPYIEWRESIFSNKTFLAIIKEVRGEVDENMQNKISNSKDYNFREKFPATHRATDGHMVRSRAEMLIDNWLYMAGIVHAYERMLPVEEDAYCDFYIPTEGGVYIEFWGLENDPKYAKRKEIKKAIYKKHNFQLIELTDSDMVKLDDVLPKMLLKFGIKTY